MRVLAIGNSFSQDATRYLHNIARADGVKLDVANLYIGGCPLDKHYRNMLSGRDVYDLQYNGHATGFPVSMEDALLNRAWDVVTLQQASYNSCKKNTFDPYITELADYVRQCQPQAKVVIHQTWAYEDGSQKLLEVAKYDTAANMFRDIKEAYDIAAKTIEADGIIPAGQLFMDLLGKGIPSVQRDTFHASYGLGRYALGLLWYRMLTGADVTENTFRDLDEETPEEQIALAKKCVNAFEPLK